MGAEELFFYATRHIELLSMIASGSVGAFMFTKKYLYAPVKEYAEKFRKLIETNEKQQALLSWIQAEMKPNGGSSMRDAISRIERRVAASETKTNLIFAQLAVAAFETDAEGKCLFVTDAWCRLTGVSHHEALGHGWINGIHPDDRDRVFEEWRQSVEQSRPFSLTYRVGQAGTYTWVNGISRVVCVGSKPVGYVGILSPLEVSPDNGYGNS